MSKNAIFFGIKIAGNFWSDQSAQAATKKTAAHPQARSGKTHYNSFHSQIYFRFRRKSGILMDSLLAAGLNVLPVFWRPSCCPYLWLP